MKRMTQRGTFIAATAALVCAAGAPVSADVVNAPATVVGVNGLTASCVPEYASAGVGGSGGISYQIQGYAVSTATDTQSTQVSCKIVGSRSGILWQGSSGYRAGNANALAQSFTLYTLESFVTCVKGDYFTSGGTIKTTTWRTAAGQPC